MSNSLDREVVVGIIDLLSKYEEAENVWGSSIEYTLLYKFRKFVYFDGLSYHFVEAKIPASGVKSLGEILFSSKEISFGEALVEMKDMKPQVSSILDSLAMSDYSKARVIMDSILEGINIGKNDD